MGLVAQVRDPCGSVGADVVVGAIPTPSGLPRTRSSSPISSRARSGPSPRLPGRRRRPSPHSCPRPARSSTTFRAHPPGEPCSGRSARRATGARSAPWGVYVRGRRPVVRDHGPRRRRVGGACGVGQAFRVGERRVSQRCRPAGASRRARRVGRRMDVRARSRDVMERLQSARAAAMVLSSEGLLDDPHLQSPASSRDPAAGLGSALRRGRLLSGRRARATRRRARSSTRPAPA